MITLDNKKKKYDFSKFRLQVARSASRAPITDGAYFRWGYRNSRSGVREDFTLEEINAIIRSGELEAYRELSNYYYRTNGDYRNNIDFLAVLPLYDTVVIPVLTSKGSQAQILKDFDKACSFVEKLDVPNTFTHITKEWLKTGIYNGILRTDGEDVVIQDLPLAYCRTRFKDFNNLPILEFNLHYFESIPDKELRLEAVESFPEIVQEAWAAWIGAERKIDPWVMIPAAAGGACFTFIDDQAPLLIASIPQLKKLEDAVGREEKRDENELYKLLIQKMPIDHNGELVFQLDEVAEIHASVASMLGDIDTVDVLTTFGDTDLESLQENSAATQSNDRIKKYRDNAYDFLGRSSLLFNADGSSALAYTIKKDEALMISYLNQYETWIKFHLNDRFSRTGLSFDFEILPTTVFNRQDIQQNYFRAAQYGYSKMFAGVVMGIKQRDQISLMDFENDFLKMSEKMIPLQSSYTTPGGEVANEEKNNSSGQKTSVTKKSDDLNNKGGRPELPDEQKSEKTQANIAAAG